MSRQDTLNKEVISIYRKVVSVCPANATFAQICEIVATQPASRFHLNSRYARQYCEARSRGEMPFIRYPHHKALLEAFYDVVTMELLCATRYDNLSRVIARALNRPAPSLGISPRVVQRIIQKTLHLHTSRNAKKH